MKTVAELQAERAQVLAEAEGILDTIDADGRELTADEEARYNAAVERAQVLNVEIERRTKLEAVQRPQFAAPGTPAVPRGQPSAEAPDDEVGFRATVRQTDAGARIEMPRSYGKLVAFAKDPKGQQSAYRAGMWLRATLYGDVNAQNWCRQNGVGVRSAMSGAVNTAGGALVPEEFERAIIDLRETYGMIRRVVRVTPMSSDTKSTPRRTGGLTAHFVGENTGGTESDAGWDNVGLTAKKLMVLTRMSSEISEDAIIDLADQMAEEIAYAFAYKEDACALIGDGTSTYGGMVGALVKAIDGSHNMAKVEAAPGHDTLGEIDSDDLIKLMSVIPKYAKPGSRWYCSPTAEELVFNAIKVGGGGNTRDMLSDSDTPRFLGYPIEVTDIMADSASTTYNDAVMIAFGNLRQAATFGDRRGIRVALSQEQYWEEDQIGVKGTERFDVNVHDLGSNTAKSPFAVLIGTT